MSVDGGGGAGAGAYPYAYPPQPVSYAPQRTLWVGVHSDTFVTCSCFPLPPPG